MAPTGTAIQYVAGNGHVPLPDPNKRVKIEQGRSQRRSIDWDAIRTQHDQRRATEGTLDEQTPAVLPTAACRWCRQPADALVDDLCPSCRTDAEAKFTAPTSTPPADEDPAATDPDVATTAASLDTANEHIINSGEITYDEVTNQDAPEPSDKGDSDRNVIQPDVTPARVDVAAYCEQLLRDTATSTLPLIQILRSNALSALAALDLAANPLQGEAPQTPVAVSAPNPTADRPAAVRQTGTATGTTSGFETFTPDHAKKVRRRGHHRANTTAIIDAYTAGATIREVVEQTGHAKNTVRQVLLDHGITLRDDRTTRSGGNNRIDAYPDALVADVRRLYLDEGKTQAETAAALGTTTKIVQSVMARHNIPARASASATSKAGVGRVQKLTPEAVDQLVARYQDGESANSLAKAYGVSTPSVLSRLRQRGVQIRSRGGNHPRAEVND